MSSQILSLSNEFNMLINKYQDTYDKYINVINTDNKTLKIVDSSAFFGQNKINTLNNSDVTNCQTACLSDSSCSGATFNTNSNDCTLSSGSGNIVPAQQSNAIVKEAMYYSYELQNLNAKLMDINEKMMNISNNSYDQYQETQKQSSQQEETMNTNYQTLSEERIHIEKMIREYETLNKAYENGNINVTSNYYSYLFLLLIVILLIFLFFKFYSTSTQSGGGSNFLSKYEIFKFIPFLLVGLTTIYLIKKYN